MALLFSCETFSQISSIQPLIYRMFTNTSDHYRFLSPSEPIVRDKFTDFSDKVIFVEDCGDNL